jgi:hypothetical protein
MSTYRATASALIQATAQQVYAIIADYRDGHARILPKLPFRALEVEQGGLGAGTIVSFQMEAFGKIQTFRSTISEPEPGRVLVETDLNTGAVTTFTVDPHGRGQQAQVTITTEGKVRDGLAGALERFLTVMFLQHTYTRELKLLAALAEQCSRVDEARR